MPETNISIKKYILRYGVILGILYVISRVVIDLNHDASSIHPVLDLSVRIIVILSGIYAYKSANGGFLKLSKAIKIGIGIAVLAAVMLSVWSILFHTIIEPDHLAKKYEVLEEQMIEDNLTMSRKDVNQGLEVSKKIGSPYIMSIITITWNALLGFFISLLGGAIMYKKKSLL
ncbi:DUF4199 domain-containing protein [Aquimarina sp. 2201CG5-10]|uniref:DUF4199 domain-containing protein n=1 Tax=Aquimarina callyspongiae TaxID=3098150 RepID=UPI002AB3BC4C|nr:DUF4199 domain-containing protein [Aquimarina sp. 2201CG5-10]MDY8137238.1 DUF4199 domain-containing protein [Aquimarina sp. 2201CG5-10]